MSSIPQASPRRGLHRALVAFAAFALVLASCGSAEDTAVEAAEEVEEVAESTEDSAEETTEGEEDHDEDEEDHDDEDHDEDEDHGDDEDHDDEDSSGLGAHEHGAADLSVAWIGAEVTAVLVSPTENVFGFEYVAETEEDIATVEDRTAAITSDGVIAINESAGCELVDPPTTELEQDGSHSEITVSWTFSCANPDDVSELDLAELFAEFPGFEDIDAEWISETSQSATELTPDQSLLSFDS